MKKQILLLLCTMLFVLSCTKEKSENELSDTQNLETITYTFNGQKITATFKVDEENDELIPIEDESFSLLNKIFDKNKTLIQHYLGDNDVVLFKNDKELNNYLEKKGRPLQKPNNNLTAISGTPYDNSQNLELYYDCCYDPRYQIHWWTDNSGYPQTFKGCVVAGTNESRLKNLADTNIWTPTITSVPVGCDFLGNAAVNYKPSDRLNSVYVRNVFARFYENINYGGRSITLDARYGNREVGFRKLRKIRSGGFFGRNWSNRISSIKLSF